MRVTGLGWWLNSPGALALGGVQTLLQRVEQKAEFTPLLRRGCFLLPNGRVVAGNCSGLTPRHTYIAMSITGVISGYMGMLKVGVARVAFDPNASLMDFEMGCPLTRLQVETVRQEWETFETVTFSLLDYAHPRGEERFWEERQYEGTSRGFAQFRVWMEAARAKYPCRRSR